MMHHGVHRFGKQHRSGRAHAAWTTMNGWTRRRLSVQPFSRTRTAGRSLAVRYGCERPSRAYDGRTASMCDGSGTLLRFGAMFGMLGAVYASMFSTDLLSEMLQDSLEQADNRRLLDFATAEVFSSLRINLRPSVPAQPVRT